MVSARDLALPNIWNKSRGWIKWGFFTDFRMGLEFIDGLIKQKQVYFLITSLTISIFLFILTILDHTCNS